MEGMRTNAASQRTLGAGLPIRADHLGRAPMKRIGFALCVLVACGDDGSSTTTTPDSPTGNHPAPQLIPGGGIGGGAIDGVVNLYVIDDTTRQPLANATVRVGTLDGTTDATGLFVAEGVVGPQTVIATVANS